MPALSTFLTTALGCFLASALLTWLIQTIARRKGWLDFPRADRWHREPTAMFGGVAIYAIFVAGLIATRPLSRSLAGLILLSTVMFAVGLYDDSKHLRPHAKLVLQLVCGLLLYSFGYHFNDAFIWWMDLLIVVAWVIAITNAVNLLDNMNGLAAGIAVIAGTFRFLWFQQTGNSEGAMASVVFVGAVAGFLVHNYPRATIFMGDAGSFTIGFALAALNLSNAQVFSKSLFSVLFFPVLVLAIPILDTSFVSVVRYFSGRAISRGGRDHVSHRLVAVGLSETAAVLVLWSVSTLGGLAAFVLYQIGFSYAWFVTALLLLGFVLFGIVLARVKVYEEHHVPADADARRRPRFFLPEEFRYKRQALWILVDAATIVLSIYGARLVADGGSPDWESEMLRLAREAPVAVAMVLIGLSARGLYRFDWQYLSVQDLGSIAFGATLGLLASLVLFVWGPFSGGDRLSTQLAAWLATVLALCATRLFVRGLEKVLIPSRHVQGNNPVGSAAPTESRV